PDRPRRYRTPAPSPLFLDKHDVHGLDRDADLVALFQGELVERVEGHDGFHRGPAADLYFDLTHHGAAFDFRHFTFQTIACADLHGWVSFVDGRRRAWRHVTWASLRSGAECGQEMQTGRGGVGPACRAGPDIEIWRWRAGQFRSRSASGTSSLGRPPAAHGRIPRQ